eukprot:5703633-Karenia_brevis.AAC.1
MAAAEYHADLVAEERAQAKHGNPLAKLSNSECAALTNTFGAEWWQMSQVLAAIPHNKQECQCE